MPGIDLACVVPSAYALATRCPVLTYYICVRMCYAMPGTDLAHVGTRIPLAQQPSVISTDAGANRIIDQVYLPTRALRHVRIGLRGCYTMSGTDRAYADRSSLLRPGHCQIRFYAHLDSDLRTQRQLSAYTYTDSDPCTKLVYGATSLLQGACSPIPWYCLLWSYAPGTSGVVLSGVRRCCSSYGSLDERVLRCIQGFAPAVPGICCFTL
eukprot:3356169-Rhodomonas_salina.2